MFRFGVVALIGVDMTAALGLQGKLSGNKKLVQKCKLEYISAGGYRPVLEGLGVVSGSRRRLPSLRSDIIVTAEPSGNDLKVTINAKVDKLRLVKKFRGVVFGNGDQQVGLGTTGGVHLHWGKKCPDEKDQSPVNEDDTINAGNTVKASKGHLYVPTQVETDGTVIASNDPWSGFKWDSKDGDSIKVSQSTIIKKNNNNHVQAVSNYLTPDGKAVSTDFVKNRIIIFHQGSAFPKGYFEGTDLATFTEDATKSGLKWGCCELEEA